MNYTPASCGHLVVAVGAPGSPARIAVEGRPCEECRPPVFRCRRCRAGPRPRGEWATRYGIAECGACLQQGYVGLLDRIEQPTPEATP